MLKLMLQMMKCSHKRIISKHICIAFSASVLRRRINAINHVLSSISESDCIHPKLVVF